MPAEYTAQGKIKRAKSNGAGGFVSDLAISAPGAPSFTVNKTSTSITAVITDSAGATSYESSVDGVTWVAGLTVSGLTPETLYTFQVRGINSGGTGPATSQGVTTNAAASLSFVPETGFSISGTVEDLASVTISGQDFGTKPPQRHFDRVDRHWKNGTEVVNPYGSAVDGDDLPTDFYNANSPFLAGGNSLQLESWRLRTAAARKGRSLGYQMNAGPDGDMEFYGKGTTNGGFAGWPSSQRDSEEVYLRFWHYQEYFDNESDAGLTSVDMRLASPVSAGATQATVVNGWSSMGSATGGLDEFYITLDNGTLHYCQQVLPRVNDETFNFTPAVPSSASVNNKVYRRKDASMKLLRMQDYEASSVDWNCYSLSGFRTQISNDKMIDEPGYTQGAGWAPGQWQLHEFYIRAPKTEADALNFFTKFARIDNLVRMNKVGLPAMDGYPGGVGGYDETPATGWPSSGIAVTNFGFEQDRHHSIPGNFVRYSDIYVDNTRQRVEIGIGADDLYQCANREPCPINTWNNSITISLNILPFTETELAQARVFVVSDDDTATLVGRIQ